MNSNINNTIPIEVIDSTESLRSWFALVRGFSLKNRSRRFEFRMVEFSPQENEHISKTVNGYYNACGCTFGSFVMSMTLVFTISIFFIKGNTLQSIGWMEVGSCLGYTLLGAFIGKILGLGYAKLRLIRYADMIIQRLYYSKSINSNLINH